MCLPECSSENKGPAVSAPVCSVHRYPPIHIIVLRGRPRGLTRLLGVRAAPPCSGLGLAGTEPACCQRSLSASLLVSPLVSVSPGLSDPVSLHVSPWVSVSLSLVVSDCLCVSLDLSVSDSLFLTFLWITFNTFIETYLTHHTVCLSEIYNSVLFNLLAHCLTTPQLLLERFHHPKPRPTCSPHPGQRPPLLSPDLQAAVRPGPPPAPCVLVSALVRPRAPGPPGLGWGCWPGPVSRSLGGKPWWLPHGLFTQQ